MNIPPGFNTVTPYFAVRGAESFLDFLVEGLGGARLLCSRRPDGSVGNAQVRLGTSTVMVSEAPPGVEPQASSYYLYVEDADASMARALAAGATQIMAVADMPYGDRQGGVRDPHGNQWWISQRLVEGGYAE